MRVRFGSGTHSMGDTTVKNETFQNAITRLERAQLMLQKTMGKQPQSDMARELQEGRIAIAINEVTQTMSILDDIYTIG